MKNFTFTFGGINSSEFGISARSFDFFNPPKRQNRKEIDFRHGSYVYNHEIYSDRYLRLNCFWGDFKTRPDIREITLWLSRQSQLVLDIEPDKYYIASLYEETDLNALWRGQVVSNVSPVGGFSLNFRCFPFAISPQTMMNVHLGVNEVDYKGTAATPTNIIIRNTGNTNIHGVNITVIGTRAAS